MPEQCNRCRFWREDMSARDPGDVDWGFGHCQRKPPTLVECMVKAHMVPLRYGQQEDPEIDSVTLSTCSMFPATSSTDWCGEYRQPHSDDAGER